MSNATSFSQTELKATFTVTIDQVEKGSVRIEPSIPDDGKVKEGTVLGCD